MTSNNVIREISVVTHPSIKQVIRNHYNWIGCVQNVKIIVAMANLAMNQGGQFVGGILVGGGIDVPSKMLSARNVRVNDAFPLDHVQYCGRRSCIDTCLEKNSYIFLENK